MRMRTRNAAAARIGAELRAAMSRNGLNAERLAQKAGKNLGHVEAVLNGYPNSGKRPTQLDTVNEIAEAMGCRLAVVPIDS
jgi:transcriptional regulator with XRE-family HTH domain